jgi:hypothetical protein
VIVLRPPAFQEHSLHFIIKYIPVLQPIKTAGISQAQANSNSLAITSDCPAAYTCWRVPHHLVTSTHWQQLLTQHAAAVSAQQLVLMQPDSPVMHVLSKFEQPQFIHAYVPGGSHSSSLSAIKEEDSSWQLQPQPLAAGSSLHLPRFNLEFELQPDGIISSKEFQHYVLADTQQLVEIAAVTAPESTTPQASSVQYKLPGFSQYLVLRLMTASSDSSGTGVTSSSASVTPGMNRSSSLVLMPVGEVLRSCAGGGGAGYAAEQVTIKLSSASKAVLKVSI